MLEVQLKDITFHYKEGDRVFDNFHLDLEKGGFHFIVGSNGSGKSTLLGLVLGAIQPSSGQVLHQGQHRNHRQLTKLIGYIPQDQSLDPEMSVSDILDFIGSCHGMAKQEVKKRKSAVLEALDIADLIEKRIKFLSGGQRQKVNIALGLIHDPEIILLDEPFTGLDYYTSIRILTALQNMDKTIICVTHDLDIAEKYATDVIILKDGLLIEKGSPKKIIEEKAFQLKEIDFAIELSENDLHLNPSIKTTIHQNRLLLSYPDQEELNQEVEAFLDAQKEDILKISTSGNDLKSSIVGLHGIGTDGQPKKEKKQKGGGDGSGGGGGQGRKKGGAS